MVTKVTQELPAVILEQKTYKSLKAPKTGAFQILESIAGKPCSSKDHR